jgi:hypothetical protein
MSNHESPPDRSPTETLAGAGFFDPSRMNPLRSLILYSIGALTGLGIAGYGLFTAAGTSTRTVPPEDMALVNQRPILRSDFMTQLESETGLKFDETTREQRLKVLDDMVREELLVQRGLELDFAETDQTTRNALVSTISQAATVEVTTSPPTEAALREYYDHHKSAYATDGIMQVRNMFLTADAKPGGSAAMASATAAATALRAGATPEVVMAQFGLLEVKRYDEDYYFAAKYRLGDTLFEAVKDLDAGQVAAPVALKDGIHIVFMVKNIKPVPLGYDASRKSVYSDYNNAAQARLLADTLKFLRDRSKILIAPDYAADYQPQDPAP